MLWKRRVDRTSWLEQAKKQVVVIQIEDETVLQQLGMIDLTETDLKIAKAVQPLVIKHIDDIVSSFYDTITSIAQLRELIVTNSSLDRLRKTLKTPLVEMFNGQFDQEFLEKRVRIAKVHYRIGLESKWYMGAFQNLQSKLLDVVREHMEIPEEASQISESITKILNFEQQLVLEAYEHENIRRRMQQYDEVKAELKTKILAVSEDMTNITERTTAAVQQLAAHSELLNQSVLRGADTSRETEQLATDGLDKLLGLKSKIDSIYDRTNQLQQMVERLNEFMVEISKVVEFVQGIADQTNLLSLNSSIEAAKAGEHAAGFSVIADEIRKLASQTKTSAEQIRTFIKETQSFTSGVVGVIGEVNQFISEGKKESDATDSTFHNILASMEVNLKDVENVEHGMGGLVDSINEMSAAMEKVSESADTLYTSVENL